MRTQILLLISFLLFSSTGYSSPLKIISKKDGSKSWVAISTNSVDRADGADVSVTINVCDLKTPKPAMLLKLLEHFH